MYIKEIEIRNIRSISDLKMTFTEPDEVGSEAGWHVLIGDNGSGKSSIVRSIALGFIGPVDVQALRLPLITWIRKDQEEANIKITIHRDKIFDSPQRKRTYKKPFDVTVLLSKEKSAGFEIGRVELSKKKGDADPFKNIWSGDQGWFSASFGPFRRFTGGDKEWSKVYRSNPRAATHLSVFGEDVALTESLEWLYHKKFQSFESNTSAIDTLDSLTRFVNEGGLLPHNAKLTNITSEGVFFKDGNGCAIDVTQLSDGFRSLLSMIFELIRQMIKAYGEQEVFRNVSNGKMSIDVPGVVLIDEVDAHLHPTWQTRIGQWFTKYFPNIQFIVTTHSPLVCRACKREKRSIWRLAAPGSNDKSGEITGIDKDRLIFGNVLDAYGTDVFGKSVTISENANDKLNRLAELNIKSIMGEITKNEGKELAELKAIFSTEELT